MSQQMEPKSRPKVRVPALAAILVVAILALLAATAGAAGNEGWGKPQNYIGRYHVKVRSGGKMDVTGGQLNLFMQEEFPGSLQPAGILKLVTKKGNNDLVYLTGLHSKGTGRGAEIHGGAFVGPKIGSFAGQQVGPGKISATFSTTGLGTVKAVFVRFSTKPTQ
jgi:hypothetical protein